MSQIRLSRFDGQHVTVPATIHGHFAIHKDTVRGTALGWLVTHVPTGAACMPRLLRARAGFRSQRAAAEWCATLEILARRAGWDTGSTSVRFDADTRARMTELLRLESQRFGPSDFRRIPAGMLV